MWDVHRIAQTIERGGIAAAEDAVTAILAQSRRQGAPRLLTDLCADRSQPSVVRERAMAKLMSWLRNDAATRTPMAG